MPPQPLFQTEKTISPEVEKEIRDLFARPAWTPKMIKNGEAITEATIQFILEICRNTPPGPDRSVAIRKAREAELVAYSAINNGGKY